MKKLLLTTFAISLLLPTASAQSMLASETDVPPTAVLRVRNNSGNTDQLTGTTETVFTFDGNGSSDSETQGHLLEVRFDFENDDEVDTYFSVTKIATHKYEIPGLKTVKMEVLDRAGNVSETFEQIYIAQNTPPNAHFAIEPKIGTTGTVFEIDTSFSSDDQYRRNLLEYRFNFDGDDNWDTKFNKKQRIEHRFNEPGLKKIIMEVRDPEDASSFHEEMVLIKENRKPVSSFALRPQSNSSYQLDASSSFDPDGSKLKYRWDYNFTGANDIQWNSTWNSSGKSYANYKKPGEYIIKLLVKDEDGATDQSFIRIFVNFLSMLA